MPEIKPIASTDFFVKKDALKASLHAMHHHPMWELCYLIKGEREYFIEDGFFKLTGGDMVLIPQNALHRVAQTESSHYMICFSEDFLKKFFTPIAMETLFSKRPIIFRADVGDRERIDMIFNTMLSEYNRSQDGGQVPNEELMAGYLYQLLFTMTHAPNIYTPHNGADGRIAQIVRYVNDNYSQIRDIEEISSRFFVSKYHLCRIFNKNLGIPLITYLNTVKIRRACSMIEEGGQNLTEIALQCGFNSSSYFCKVFKAEKGISPTEYKKRHRT